MNVLQNQRVHWFGRNNVSCITWSMKIFILCESMREFLVNYIPFNGEMNLPSWIYGNLSMAQSGVFIMSLLILPSYLHLQFKNLLILVDPGFANICKVYLTLNEVLGKLFKAVHEHFGFIPEMKAWSNMYESHKLTKTQTHMLILLDTKKTL